MHLLALPLKNLLRRPLRSALTALGVAVAVACVLGLLTLSHSLDRGWVDSLRERGTHLVVFRKDSGELMAGSLPAEWAARLEQIPGVTSVSSEALDMLAVGGGRTQLVSGYDTRQRLWGTLNLVAGRRPQPGETGVAMAGESAATRLGLKPGSAVTLRGKTFTLVGVYRQGSRMGNNVIILPLADLQELTSLRARVNAFYLQVDRPDDAGHLADVARRVSETFPDAAVCETERMLSNSETLGLVRSIAWGVSVLAVLMGGLAILNTLLMSVTERTREIGVLSAVGWPGRRILALIVLEGMLLSLIGTAVGCVAGRVLLAALSQHPRLVGYLEPRVPPELLLPAGAVAVAVGTLAGLYPAARAVRLNVLSAIRHE